MIFDSLLIQRLRNSQDKNLGLINQALEHAARWSIRKLTGTYLTLHISDIGQAVGIDSEDEVRALILDMVSSTFTFFFLKKVMMRCPSGLTDSVFGDMCSDIYRWNGDVLRPSRQV